MGKKKNKRADEDYEKTILYCTDQGWKVVDGDDLECRAEEDGTITIGSVICQPIKLFSLLHEVGHLTLWGQVDFDERFPGYQKSEKHKFHKAALLEEEIKAWDEGLKVALSLDLEIDLKEWFDHRYSCIYSYIRWARAAKWGREK